MRNILLILYITLIGIPVNAQQTLHAVYDFSSAYYVQFPFLNNPTKVVSVSFEWHIISDSRYSLLFPNNIKTSSDIEANIALEQENDTILFDRINYKAYVFSQQKWHTYQPRYVASNGREQIRFGDTMIIFSPQFPEPITPLPHLISRDRGIRVYKTKKFNFIHREVKPSPLQLEKIYARVKHFSFSRNPLPLGY